MSEFPVSCYRCKDEFLAVSSLEDHIDQRHGSIDCPKCLAPYRNDEELADHLSYVHECPECGQHLDSMMLRTLHLADAHGLRYELPYEDLRPLGAVLVYLPGREPEKEPVRDEDRCLWLYPFFLEYCRAGSGTEFLNQPPRKFSSQFAYISRDLDRVRKVKQLAKFKERSSPDAQARFLSRAFTLLQLQPSYSEQRMRKTEFVLNGSPASPT